MDTEGRSRTDLALPEPQRPSSASEIELSEVPLHENVLQEEDTPPPPRRTWLTFFEEGAGIPGGNTNFGWFDMPLFWNDCLLHAQYFRI